MNPGQLANIWGLLNSAYPTMGAFTESVKSAWMEFVGWADYELMYKAALSYISDNKYKPAPSQLKELYLQIKRGEEARDRKYPNLDCKYCQGEGWVKRLIPNGTYGLTLDTNFGCDFLPCGCCDNKRGHELYDQLVNSPYWVWDEYLRGFRPNDAWIGEPPPATAKEIQAVTELFAKESPPRDNSRGMDWDYDSGVDYFRREA